MLNHRASLRKSKTVTILRGIAATARRTSKHVRGRRYRRQDEFPVHNRPPSHPGRIERRAPVGKTPTRASAFCCVCRCRWSIVALFGTMGPENKNERSRGRSNLFAVSPPTLAKEKAPIQHRGSPCSGDPFPIFTSYLLRCNLLGRLPKAL